MVGSGSGPVRRHFVRTLTTSPGPVKTSWSSGSPLVAAEAGTGVPGVQADVPGVPEVPGVRGVGTRRPLPGWTGPEGVSPTGSVWTPPSPQSREHDPPLYRDGGGGG